MDKRFKTKITIDIHLWETIVMAEAGYDYEEGWGYFDWGRFNEEHGFTYEEMGIECMSVSRQVREVLGWGEGAANGSYQYVDSEYFDPKYAENEGCSPEVNKLRKEICEAALRCFDKGIAPEEFMLDINW